MKSKKWKKDWKRKKNPTNSGTKIELQYGEERKYLQETQESK